MKLTTTFAAMLLLLFMIGCSGSDNENAKEVASAESSCGDDCSEQILTAGSEDPGCAGCDKNETTIAATDNKKAKVTFIELGSDKCIPCKQMKPVMEAIEKKFGDQVNVVFYDVWKPEQKHYAKDYGVNIIPTQVFLDENGKEFHRHEGFYPETEISKILKEKGLTSM